MDVGDCELILSKILHSVSPRQMSNFAGHLPIMPDERLALTLHYITTGDSLQSLSFQFTVSLNVVSYIIKGSCNALVYELIPVFVNTPSSEQEWLKISKKFEDDALPNSVIAPYVFVGDDVFALKKFKMKPYPQKI